MADSTMAALLIYHIALGSFAIYIILAIWPASFPIPATRNVQLFFGRLSFTLTVELTLLLAVVFAALVGAFVHSLGSIAFHKAYQDLDQPWTAWYVMRPFLGAGLALILYFALRAGFLTLGTEASTINLYGVAALSGIVGMFTARATEKLKDVADSLLRPVTEPSEAAAEGESSGIGGLPAEGEGTRPLPPTGGGPETEAPAPVVGETRAGLPREGVPAAEEEEASGTPDRPSVSRTEPRGELGEIREGLDSLRELVRRLEEMVSESVPETGRDGEG